MKWTVHKRPNNFDTAEELNSYLSFLRNVVDKCHARHNRDYLKFLPKLIINIRRKDFKPLIIEGLDFTEYWNLNIDGILRFWKSLPFPRKY